VDEVLVCLDIDRSEKFVLMEEESSERNEPRGTFYSREDREDREGSG
jgi:hypothetical protein